MTKGPTQEEQSAFNKELCKDHWPIERDLLYRPDRFRYVRKLVRPTGCVFCSAALDPQKSNEQSEADREQARLVLHRESHSLVILNKFPYNPGHLLVVPFRHEGDLLALSEEEYGELHALVRVSVHALKQAYGCEGINLGMNLGAAGGAGIPDHLHYHLIPRWVGDSNFFPIIAETKVLAETLEQSHARLLPYFKKSHSGSSERERTK